MKFSIFTTVATIFVAAVNASPIARPDLEARDVFVPRITYPTSGLTWTSGKTYTVTWDAANAPTQITNNVGRIFLRKGERTTPFLLANNFNILDGKVEITVPLLVEDNDYTIVLFGDSGNFSPPITIKGSGYSWKTFSPTTLPQSNSAHSQLL